MSFLRFNICFVVIYAGTLGLTAVQDRVSNLLPKTCGKTSGSDRIVGGAEAALDASPWLALIEYEDKVRGSFRALCGGGIISSKYVLTAAHCITINNKVYSPPKRVRLGEHDLRTSRDCRPVDDDGNEDCNDSPLFVPVESYEYHKDYVPSDKSHHNDIALVRLANAITMTDFIAPICLPSASPNAPTSVYASGWGTTDNSTTSNVKLEIKSFVVEREACQYAYNRFKVNLFDGQICAGGQEGIDTCRGDSGGPLSLFARATQTWEAVGVISFGPNACGTFGIPGVYTNVAYYRDWIISHLKP